MGRPRIQPSTSIPTRPISLRFSRHAGYRAVLVGFALAIAGCGDSTSVTSPTESTEPVNESPASISDSGADSAATTQTPAPEEVSNAELVSGSTEIDGGLITTISSEAPASSSTVVFLHGAAFTSQTWVQNGVLVEVIGHGIHVVAVDLPGFGSSGRVGVENEEFLAALFVALDLDPTTTTIVSPSMSGGFSLPALRQPFFANLAGFVPVAPVGVGPFLDGGPALDIAALVVWGDGDGADPQDSADTLAGGFTNSSVLILPDAGHAAYQQQPELFAQALIDFVELNETS